MEQADELAHLRSQARTDRKLIRRAAEVLAEIDRGAGLSDAHADVLAALRIRLEGRSRASLEDLLTAVGDAGAAKRDLGDALSHKESDSREWPSVEDEKRDWPGL